jgi:hypothetical protein
MWEDRWEIFRFGDTSFIAEVAQEGRPAEFEDFLQGLLKDCAVAMEVCPT